MSSEVDELVITVGGDVIESNMYSHGECYASPVPITPINRKSLPKKAFSSPYPRSWIRLP
jgi:hypothetical protein